MAASLVNHDQTPSNGNRSIIDGLYILIIIAFDNHMCDNTILAIADVVRAINGATAIMLLAMATMHTVVVLEM